jgi:3,4-dihydroxy-2-butanone 4-phosphate synthase
MPTDIHAAAARIEPALAAYRRGQFLLVSDDEDRENEGDLVIAASHADAAAVNFMVTHGRGLVCLAVAPEIAARLGLRPMVERGADALGTAFTVSVDAAPRHGVTTGISAADRARTIAVVLDERCGPPDLCSPGHLFPLVGRPGGLRERRGHTEAAIELSRLAGLPPAGAIVEVLRPDGEMARRDDIAAMARRFGLHHITIEDLAAYLRGVRPDPA